MERHVNRTWAWPCVALLVGVLIGGIATQSTRWISSLQDFRMLLFLRTETGSTRTAKLLLRHAKDYDIPPLAFAAIIWQESKFKANASGIRPKGAMGAGESDRGMGGMWSVRAAEIAENIWHDKELADLIRSRPQILYQPDLNLDLTAANHRDLLDTHKSVHDIFDAYKFHNAGESGKGSLKNVTAVKDRYYHYRRKYDAFNWRKAR